MLWLMLLQDSAVSQSRIRRTIRTDSATTTTGRGGGSSSGSGVQETRRVPTTTATYTIDTQHSTASQSAGELVSTIGYESCRRRW